MSLFPEDDKARKMLPIFKMQTRYFPKALREVTKVCVANNVRYNPDRDPADLNWARGKSPDQLGSAYRHMLEREVDGKVFEGVSKAVTEATGIECIYVLAEAAWRLLAQLELDIEQQEAMDRQELETRDAMKAAAHRAIADQRPEWEAGECGLPIGPNECCKSLHPHVGPCGVQPSATEKVADPLPSSRPEKGSQHRPGACSN